MNWGHVVWAGVVGAILTSVVVVMGRIGLVSPSLSDFALLLYMRLALLSGASYLVFNRVSFRQRRMEARRRSEPDPGFARGAVKSDALVPTHHKREDLEDVGRHDHLSQVNV